MKGLLTSDTALVRRARYGDRRAARRLAARHLDRMALLCAVVSTEPRGTPEIAPQAFALALRQKTSFDDALVIAFARLVESWPDARELQARLLTVLLEIEMRPADEAASLLGLSPSDVSALRTTPPPAAGGRVNPGRACRGWGLASRRTGLTSAERRAGEAHLLLCRRCRERLSLLDRARAQLVGGSAGAAGGVMAVAQLLPAIGGKGASAGLGGLLTGKAGAAVVGTLATAVLVTGGTTAVAGHPAVQRPAPHSVPAHPAVEPTAAPAPAAQLAPAPVATRAPSPTSALVPDLPPVTRPDENTVPVPTAVPSLLPVPVLPLPALPLPTELPHLVPLPSPVGRLLDLP